MEQDIKNENEKLFQVSERKLTAGLSLVVSCHTFYFAISSISFCSVLTVPNVTSQKLFFLRLLYGDFSS